MADRPDIIGPLRSDEATAGLDVEVEITDPVWIARFDAARSRHRREVAIAKRQRRG